MTSCTFVAFCFLPNLISEQKRNVFQRRSALGWDARNESQHAGKEWRMNSWPESDTSPCHSQQLPKSSALPYLFSSANTVAISLLRTHVYPNNKYQCANMKCWHPFDLAMKNCMPLKENYATILFLQVEYNVYKRAYHLLSWHVTNKIVTCESFPGWTWVTNSPLFVQSCLLHPQHWRNALTSTHPSVQPQEVAKDQPLGQVFSFLTEEVYTFFNKNLWQIIRNSFELPANLTNWKKINPCERAFFSICASHLDVFLEQFKVFSINHWKLYRKRNEI